jgi:hypothetical protein
MVVVRPAVLAARAAAKVVALRAAAAVGSQQSACLCPARVFLL